MSEAYSSLRVMLFDILQCSFLFVYLTPSSEMQQHAPPAACLPAAATVSRGTLRPVIYLGRECAASVTSYPPPVVGRRGILQHLYRVVTDTGLRALRDLRAPLARYAFLGFLRHPPTHPCRKQALYIAGQSEPPVLPLLCLTGSMLLLLL